MIETRNIVLRAGGRTLLDRVSLRIEPRRITTIIGPNGAGKSTLLKVMAGDIAPHDGEVLLDGRDLARCRPHELALRRAVLPQASTLAFPFTVHEVVRLGVGGGLSPAQSRQRVAAALERVDLEAFGARLFQELSGGEQQRVHLARVLCQVWEPVSDGAPRILFLDEPTSSLDLRHQLMTLDMARSFASAGGAVVVILHDLNLAALYADHLVVIDGGRVAAQGTTTAILTPAMMRAVFGVDVAIGKTVEGVPYILPRLATAA